MRRLLILTWLVCATTIAGPFAREAAAAADHDFFERRIRPILVKHCYECHSATSKKLGGNLRLDTRAGWRTGGDNGPAIVAGEPKKSLLFTAVRYDDDSLQMPPAGKLPQAAIDDLERWIKDGAADPRVEDTAVATKKQPDWSETLAARRSWWSLQPVRKPDVPPAVDRAANEPPASLHPIDRFIAAGLSKQSLEPAPPADPRTLYRRLSLVVTGLPPKPEEVDDFVRRGHDGVSYAALVDRLLASPHFGERWARHWMDVVRFSETHGNEWNYEVPYAWRYRDYLIRAFNADVPYDRFVQEHIAGDLLTDPRVNHAEQFNESVIGTAFYRFGEVNHDDCIGLRQIGYDLADNQLDTLTKAFQATTVACARCHDHKIDAVSTRDYHALLGVLRSSRSVMHTIDLPEANGRTIARLQELKKQIRPLLADAWTRDTADIGRYMRAAAAAHLKRPDAAQLGKGLNAERLARWQKVLNEKSTPDDPFAPWRSFVSDADDPSSFSANWDAFKNNFYKESKERFAAQQNATIWAEFRGSDIFGWQARGQGIGRFRSGDLESYGAKAGRYPTGGNEFVVAPSGDVLIAAILPAGFFTHTVSDKLNGTLHSPPLPATGKYISLEVVGRRSAAVRLVSNNCQLNYKNYRALTSDEPTWVTFSMPDDRATLGTYVELMTMLDNPKFPDQLSALGGDKANYRLPWDEAAGDKRSYFGVTRVLIHDDPKPPGPTFDNTSELLYHSPKSLDDLADAYGKIILRASSLWRDGIGFSHSPAWLDAFLRRGLLSNSAQELSEVAKLVDEYRRIEADLQTPRITPGLGDFGSGFDQPIFVRGDWQRPGPKVARGYLEVLGADEFRIDAGSGRLELAHRIGSDDNPLTARVMVNRTWHHMFGAGLVRTVDDFGRIGELPSHPALLDYLAARFVEEGWSVKKLIRFIATSQTFRAAAAPSTAAVEVDPENRLLSHYPARRLEAEGIRDALLAASGRLDRSMYGPSVQPYRETANNDRRLFPGPLDGAGRRSIYIKFNLMESAKFLSAFNIPGGKVAQGRRDVSQVPAQALALLNDPLVAQQAGVWAEHLVKNAGDTRDARIARMFLTAYGRPPRRAEQVEFAALIMELAKQHGVAEKQVLTSVPVWRDAAHALFTTEEFIYIP